MGSHLIVGTHSIKLHTRLTSAPATFYSDILQLPDAFSLEGCTNLKKLFLRCPVMYDQSLPWVHSLLARSPLQSLQHIDLEVRLLGSAKAINWAEIGRLLSQSTTRSLSSVTLSVILWSYVNTQPKEVEAMIREHLAALDKRGVLEVTIV